MPQKTLADAHPLLHDHSRLMIITALAAEPAELDFLQLVERLALTKGNLSVHLKKLEEAGLVAIKKEFVGRKPRTSCRCTPAGRTAVREYLGVVEGLLHAVDRSDEG